MKSRVGLTLPNRDLQLDDEVVGDVRGVVGDEGVIAAVADDVDGVNADDGAAVKGDAAPVLEGYGFETLKMDQERDLNRVMPGIHPCC